MSHFTAADLAAIAAHEGTDLDAPATESELAEFERAVGVSLPASHKELLRRGNGGTVGQVRLFGVNRSDSLDLGRQIENTRTEFEQASQGPVLPFARDWGGSYFCFDLRAPGPEYPVLYRNHMDTEEPGRYPLIWSPFADDFVTFVRRVVIVPHEPPPHAPGTASHSIDALEYARPGGVRPAKSTSSLWFCITVIGIGVVLNLGLVMSSFADVSPTVRGGVKGLGVAVNGLGFSPILNGLLMLISLAAALVMRFSGSRAPCVLVALIVPFVGVVTNLVVMFSIMPKSGGGIFMPAY